MLGTIVAQYGELIMASIRKRNGKWQVQIRRTGHLSLNRSFIQKINAVRWIREMEIDLDQNGLVSKGYKLLDMKFSQILCRYRDEIIIHKKSAESESYFIGCLLKHEISKYPIKHLTRELFTNYRDERLKEVKCSTVSRQFSIIRHALTIAKREWGLPIRENPAANIKMPSKNKGRNRRLNTKELDILLDGCSSSRVSWLSPLIQLAIETGMRRGELINIQSEHVDLDLRTLYIPHTKTGEPRTIPLSSHAVHLLSNLIKNEEVRIFPITGNAIRMAWGRLKNRVGITDLHFHDLRHEATSRFFEKGLNVMEVATITGHKDLRMLQRYTHLRAEDLAKKLG
ncbi:MAG TPA: site-specific integrase [Rhodospirillales bacterium]|jgi:integrase|nr:site-specific integrase [Rhodospirillales bacterium]HIL74763.1 site-specific integrase [Rhodospirillales bacterium]